MSLIQLKALLWKHCRLRQRRYLFTIGEVLLPLVLFLTLSFSQTKLRIFEKSSMISSSSSVLSENSSSLWIENCDPIYYVGINLEATRFFITPNSDFTDNLIRRVQEKFQIITNNIRMMNIDKEQMFKLCDIRAATTKEEIIAIIIHSAEYDLNFNYTLRFYNAADNDDFDWNSKRLYQTWKTFTPSQSNPYIWKGFLALQQALDLSFIELRQQQEQTINLMTTNLTNSPHWTLQACSFPYNEHQWNNNRILFRMECLSFVTLFSFLFVSPLILTRILEEKKTGGRDLLKMINISRSLWWFSWFLYGMIPLSITILIVISSIKLDFFSVGNPLIVHTNILSLLIFFLLYIIALIVFGFCLSTFLSQPHIASLVCLLLGIMSFFLPKYLLENQVIAFTHSEYLFLLLPNMAVYYAYQIIGFYEIQDHELTFFPNNKSEEMSLFSICSMLLLDIIVYMLITLLLEEFFERNSKKSKGKKDKIPLAEMQEEAGSCCSKKIIELRNVTKNYNGIDVVKDLSMDFYRNQITIILGHNGAGKSTTIGMIANTITPTSGRVVFHNRNDDNNSFKMGICSQENLFFSHLTVIEHLEFFAKFRSSMSKPNELSRELDNLIIQLKLDQHKFHFVSTISGGMKRKLCLGMALITGSSILLLDEPTANVDSESRHDILNLLLKWRTNRTIIITTHNLEDAEQLGDSIAILNEGHLVSYGSQNYLKQTFDLGYNLHLTMNRCWKNEYNDRFRTQLLEKFTPNIQLKGIVDNTITYMLSINETQQFIQLLEYLEQNQNSLQIDTVAVTFATLEEIFVNSNFISDNNNDDDVKDATIINDTQLFKLKSPLHVTWWETHQLIFEALVRKKITNLIRQYWTYILPLILTISLIILGILLTHTFSTKKQNPILKFSLTTYGKNFVLLEARSNDNNNNSSNNDSIINNILLSNSQHIVEKENSTATLVTSLNTINNQLETISQMNLNEYQKKFIVALQFRLHTNPNNTTSNQALFSSRIIECRAMYNNFALHSAPISLNLITNTIIKSILGSNYSISTYHWPPFRNNQNINQMSNNNLPYIWLFLIVFGFHLNLATFIPFIHSERSSLNIQYLSNLKPWNYWLIVYSCDILIHFFSTLLLTLIVSLFWTPFYGITEGLALLCLQLLYGVSGIPFVYLFGASFRGSLIFVLCSIIGGNFFTLLTVTLNEYQIEQSHFVSLLLSFIFPPYIPSYLGYQYTSQVITNFKFKHIPSNLLMECNNNRNSSSINPCCINLISIECKLSQNYFPNLTSYIPSILLSATFYLAIQMLKQNYCLLKSSHNFAQCLLRPFRNRKNNNNNNNNLSSINASSNNMLLSLFSILQPMNNTCRLEVSQLNKNYQKRQLLENISLQIDAGHCCGIVGINGVGKSALCQILTRQEMFDTGWISLNYQFPTQKKILSSSNQYQSHISYCSQTNTFNENFTGRELLTYMALLRGICQNNDDNLIDFVLNIFGLMKHANILSRYYSGGTKRKLNFALALIGLPTLIVLDEPTEGVDLMTRQILWELINRINKLNQNIFMLISHNPIEYETICNELVILHKGEIYKRDTVKQFQDELKNLLYIIFKMNSSSYNSLIRNSLDRDVKKQFPNALLETSLIDDITTPTNILTYFVRFRKNKPLKWTQILLKLETIKIQYCNDIEEYIIKPVLIDRILLNLSK